MLIVVLLSLRALLFVQFLQVLVVHSVSVMDGIKVFLAFGCSIGAVLQNTFVGIDVH